MKNSFLKKIQRQNSPTNHVKPLRPPKGSQSALWAYPALHCDRSGVRKLAIKGYP